MSFNTLITEELLLAYFAGQVTVLQKRGIEIWLKNPENEEFFYECVHKWELKNPQYLPDVNQAIKRFKNDLLKTPKQSEEYLLELESEFKGYPASPALTPRSWITWLVAASVVLLLGLSGWFFRNHVLYKTYQTDYGEISTIILPDGSKVTLNANSKLVISRLGFGNFNRQVTLKGEANFVVVHTPDNKKFVVLTDSLFKVEVLGTEFNVFARERATKVGLYKGKVNVLLDQPIQSAKSFTMAPGELLINDKIKQTLQIRKVPHPENFSAWQQGRYIFDNTTLAEIKNILKENYGLEVELKEKGFAEQTISGSYKAYPINEFLLALAETLEMKVHYQHNKVFLTEKD